MRNTAVRLITENGRDVTVRTRVTSAVDPVTGTVTTGYIDVPALAVFPSISDTNRPEGEILAGDKLCFVTETVEMTDLIVDGGEAWQVVVVDEYLPGPTYLVSKCVVRK